ncbi:hypothetical protein PoHVEF18_007234 [Penicillium ochrochloron]
MIVKEFLRWRPPAPGLFPYTLTKEGKYSPSLRRRTDEEIAGMSIPKGTAVVLNVCGIHHNPKRYPEPHIFKPPRFTGRHLAERALFIAIAKLLWAFSIQHKLNSARNPIPVDVSPSTAYSDGFLNQCLPFEVDVKPRTEKRRKVILTAAKANVF